MVFILLMCFHINTDSVAFTGLKLGGVRLGLFKH